MIDPFLAEITTVSFDFAPAGWLPCDGRALRVAQAAALFSLIGNKFGGEYGVTLALPDLRGRFDVGMSQTNLIGRAFGAATMKLGPQDLPAHIHSTAPAAPNASVSIVSTLSATTQPGQANAPAAGLMLAAAPSTVQVYGPATAPTAMNAVATAPVAVGSASLSLSSTGANAPFSVMPPCLALMQIIAVQGVYPVRP